jgi:hypothetical protein
MVGGLDWVKVGTGRNLPNVSRERAVGLVGQYIEPGMGKIEVVVALSVVGENRIIKHGGKIDWSTLRMAYILNKSPTMCGLFKLTLFHRPTVRAPISAEPCSGVKPGSCTGLSARNFSNSGTNSLNWRNTRNDPSVAQAGRVTVIASLTQKNMAGI